CSFVRVTSRPSISILPSSHGSAPAIRLSNVLFPAPFPPIRETNSPEATSRSTPLSAAASDAVPRLNTLRSPKARSIARSFDHAFTVRQGCRQHHSECLQLALADEPFVLGRARAIGCYAGRIGAL